MVWHILEDYGGHHQTRLYRGSNSQLGEQRPLSARLETRDLPKEQPVPTGLTDVACVFIPNTLDEDPTRGITDYLGVVRAFFAINEAASVGQANVRSTGLKRLLVDGRYRNSSGNLPAGRDVFWMDSALQDASAPAWHQGGRALLRVPGPEDRHDQLIDMALTFAGGRPRSARLEGRGTAVGHRPSPAHDPHPDGVRRHRPFLGPPDVPADPHGPDAGRLGLRSVVVEGRLHARLPPPRWPAPRHHGRGPGDRHPVHRRGALAGDQDPPGAPRVVRRAGGRRDRAHPPDAQQSMGHGIGGTASANNAGRSMLDAARGQPPTAG